MHALRFALFLLVFGAGAASFADSRETAWQARTIVGDGVWSRVLHIENERAGRKSPYPADFHALVVAFEDILWFYTEFDGTQTLSRYRGRVATDQNDLGPLLRAIDPGLTHFTDVTDQPPSRIARGLPPQPCFLACVAHWLELQRSAHPPTQARLVAGYLKPQPIGHMMLEYRQGGRRFLYDPDYALTAWEIPHSVGTDPLDVASAMFEERRLMRPVRAMQLELFIDEFDGGTIPASLDE